MTLQCDFFRHSRRKVTRMSIELDNTGPSLWVLRTQHANSINSSWSNPIYFYMYVKLNLSNSCPYHPLPQYRLQCRW